MKTQKITVSEDIKQLESIKIKDSASMSLAVSYLSKANQYLDKLTEEKEKLTKPINEALKEIRARYKPAEIQLEAIIANIRSKISSYQTIQIAKQRESEAKIASKLASGDISLDKAITKIESIKSPESRVSSDSGSITFKEVKRFRIVDISKIPAKYMIPDDKAITEAMKSSIEIPGIEYFTEQIPINRR